MISLFFFVTISKSIQSYNEDDEITAYLCKIGSNENSAESYRISSFPLFRDMIKKKTKGRTYEDAFFGNDPQDIGIYLKFTKNSEKQMLQKVTLTKSQMNDIEKAIKKSYCLTIFVDGLPTWYNIGTYQNGVSHIYQNMHFKISYNNGNIIAFQISGNDPIPIDDNSKNEMEVHLSYTVDWIKVNADAQDRIQNYNNDDFFYHPVHKYSLINSSLLSVLLLILVVLLLNNVLSSDYNRFMAENAFDGFEVEINKENGWKALHGDIFRPPHKLPLLAVLSGSGVHLLIFAIVYSITSTYFSMHTKAFSQDFGFSAGFNIYIATSLFSGLAAVSFGKAFGISKWLNLAIGAACLTPFFYLFLTTVYSLICSMSGLSFSFSIFHIAILSVISAISIVPLNYIGGYCATKLKLFEINKCDVSLVPRQIPKQPFFAHPYFLALIVGIVCTSSIIIEIYYMLSTMWHNIGEYSWFHLFLCILFFAIISACSTIFAIYLMLNFENHHWHWPAFFIPATTGLYILLYSIYYMVFHTQINGYSQIIFYLSCTLILSFCIALFAGGSGFLGCNIFVHILFSNMKLD